MFKSARIKLTSWYLLIIMLISTSFSVVIYRVLTSELDRVERMQRTRIERGLPGRLGITILPDSSDDLPQFLYLDPALLAETKIRLATMLVIINFGILAGSATAAYFLAGRTLKPIADMVDQQYRFISDASHELRTPLTSLKSEIEVNLRDKNLTLADARKLLASNLEEANNLQVLSDGLIKLSQYQKGENGLAIANISLAAITAEAIGKIVKLAKSKNITIINKVENVTLEANKPTLTEVFVIFLDNAIKYSPKGTKVTLASAKTDGNILVRISDEGMGISPEDLPHIFDRFYRADKSRTKSNIHGYGLGLSIAKQIIDKHRGTIRVQSKPGAGTTFTLQLPLSLHL
jgi:signal transduction histidine kinase